MGNQHRNLPDVNGCFGIGLKTVLLCSLRCGFGSMTVRCRVTPSDVWLLCLQTDTQTIQITEVQRAQCTLSQWPWSTEVAVVLMESDRGRPQQLLSLAAQLERSVSISLEVDGVPAPLSTPWSGVLCSSTVVGKAQISVQALLLHDPSTEAQAVGILRVARGSVMLPEHRGSCALYKHCKHVVKSLSPLIGVRHVAGDADSPLGHDLCAWSPVSLQVPSEKWSSIVIICRVETAVAYNSLSKSSIDNLDKPNKEALRWCVRAAFEELKAASQGVLLSEAELEARRAREIYIPSITRSLRTLLTGALSGEMKAVSDRVATMINDDWEDGLNRFVMERLNPGITNDGEGCESCHVSDWNDSASDG